MATCPICGSAATVDISNPHELKITCSGCVKFSITEVALNTIPKNIYPNWSKTLQEYIQMHQTDGLVEITDRKIKSIFGF